MPVDVELLEPLRLEIEAARNGRYARLTLLLPGMTRPQTLRLNALQAHELAMDALTAASSIEILPGLDGEPRSMRRSVQPQARIAPQGPWSEAATGTFWLGHFQIPVTLEPPEEKPSDEAIPPPVPLHRPPE